MQNPAEQTIEDKESTASYCLLQRVAPLFRKHCFYYEEILHASSSTDTSSSLSECAGTSLKQIPQCVKNTKSELADTKSSRANDWKTKKAPPHTTCSLVASFSLQVNLSSRHQCKIPPSKRLEEPLLGSRGADQHRKWFSPAGKSKRALTQMLA